MTIEQEEYFIEHYQGMIRWTLKHLCYIPRGEYEDCFQEGAIGLINAIYKMDQINGSFSGYAFACIKYSVWNYTGKRKQLKNKANYAVRSFDKEIEMRDSNNKTLHDFIGDIRVDIAQEVVNKITIKYIFQFLKNESCEIRRIFGLYYNGYNFNEIARKFKSSKWQIERIFSDIVVRFKKDYTQKIIDKIYSIYHITPITLNKNFEKVNE
jgi:RNA polymerase sigma factor (sigma-70 family)